MVQGFLGRKVGFFVSSESWINHQQWHYEVSKALYERGYEVSIITSKQGKLYIRSKRNGLPVCAYTKRKSLLRNLVQLIRILRKEEIAILFINNPRDLKRASLAARFAGVERVIYRRGTVSHVKKTLITKLIFNHLITRIITNSGANRELMLNEQSKLFQGQTIDVIYNGLNVHKFDNKSLVFHVFRNKGELVV